MPKGTVNHKVLQVLINKFSTPEEIEQAVKKIHQSDLEAYEKQCIILTGQTIMNIAALGFRNEFADKAKILLSVGFDPNKQEGDFKNTTLQLLIANEDFDNARKLIEISKEKEKEVDLSITDSQGKTALIFLAKMGTQSATDFACYLLSKNPSHVTVKDDNGLSVEQYALLHGNIPLMKALAKTGQFSFSNIDDQLNKIKRVDINNVLKSVSIDPTRAENSRQNNLVDYLGQSIVTFNSEFKFHEITAKKKKSSGKKLRSLKGCLFVDTAKLKRTSNLHASISASHKESFFKQYQGLSKKSISEKCHEDQLTLAKSPLLQRQLQEKAWQGYTQKLTSHRLKNGPLSFLESREVAKCSKINRRFHSDIQPFLNTFTGESKRTIRNSNMVEL